MNIQLLYALIVKYDIRLKYLKGLNKLPLNYYTYGRLTQMILSSVAYRHMIYGYKLKSFEIKNETN